MRIRLAISTGPTSTAIVGARARVELGDLKAAVERLKQHASDLQEKGKSEDGLRLLTEAAQLDTDDLPLRQLLVQAHIARGDFNAASQFATSADELQHLATELFGLGRDDEGLKVLTAAADADSCKHVDPHRGGQAVS